MDSEDHVRERFHVMLRDVIFLAHHYRSMARMVQLILFLQLAILWLTFQRKVLWLSILQVVWLGFAVCMMGRSFWLYRRKARGLERLEKSMLQFGACRNESQFWAAQEQVQAALEAL